MASFLQGRLKVPFRYLHLLDSLKTIAPCIKASAATLSLRSTDKLNTLILQLVQNGYRMLYSHFDGLAIFSFVHSFPFTQFFVAILTHIIFQFVSRGCGFAYGQLKFAFDYNTDWDYKRLGEGNIFFITPPLPRTQGRIRIYIHV